MTMTMVKSAVLFTVAVTATGVAGGNSTGALPRHLGEQRSDTESPKPPSHSVPPVSVTAVLGVYPALGVSPAGTLQWEKVIDVLSKLTNGLDKNKDVFGNFTRVESIPDRWITIGGIKYDLGNNKKLDEGVEPDANILMYESTNEGSGPEYILQVDGKLIYIADADTVSDNKTFTEFQVYDSQAQDQGDIDAFAAFANRKGIDEHTVLGAKIILKKIMEIIQAGPTETNGVNESAVCEALRDSIKKFEDSGLWIPVYCDPRPGEQPRPNASPASTASTTSSFQDASGAHRGASNGVVGVTALALGLLVRN